MAKKHFHVFDKGIEDEKIEHYDVCILGGGAAGLTSAIYSTRYGLHTALIAKTIGGAANLAEKIENYPGFEGSGLELMQKFWKQAEKLGTEFLNSVVVNIQKDKTGFIVELKNGKVVHSRTIIVALGTEKRKLNIPGEDEFVGRGVSYCATCDAAFFKGKEVVVIGGSNSAAKTALILSKMAKKVYILYRREELRCDEIDKKKIKEKKNIEVIYNAIPLKIVGNTVVKGLEINQKGKERKLRVAGVFVEIGSVPISGMVKKLGVKTDKEGYIIVDENMATNIKGVFAAGDTIKSKLKQIVVSAGQGALAAASAKDYLDK
jgi:thioredoxin reductase (NADPH)